MSIVGVTGAHLTAADRRNITAVLGQPGFASGRRYQVNGRKHYTVTAKDGNRYVVYVEEVEIDGWGRRNTRVHRSEFGVR